MTTYGRRKKLKTKFKKYKNRYEISFSASFINLLDPTAHYRVLYFKKDGVK